jgi:hypothetical protein
MRSSSMLLADSTQECCGNCYLFIVTDPGTPGSGEPTWCGKCKFSDLDYLIHCWNVCEWWSTGPKQRQLRFTKFQTVSY